MLSCVLGSTNSALCALPPALKVKYYNFYSTYRTLGYHVKLHQNLTSSLQIIGSFII